MALFFQVLAAIFVAEMGDKTQLLMIAMTAKYKMREIIIGTLASIMALNAIAVALGSLVSELIPMWLIKLIAGIAFFYFAASSIYGIFKKSDEEEKNIEQKGGVYAVLAVFGTFFIAELGDKTQLAALTFSANAGFSGAFIVWAAATIGLFAADIIGLIIVHFLKMKAPENLINIIAAVIFAVFGFITIVEGVKLLCGGGALPFIIAAGTAVLFVIVTLVMIKFYKRHGRKSEQKRSAH